eukprot:3668035-Rhodomonas_salina.1
MEQEQQRTADALRAPDGSVALPLSLLSLFFLSLSLSPLPLARGERESEGERGREKEKERKTYSEWGGADYRARVVCGPGEAVCACADGTRVVGEVGAVTMGADAAPDLAVECEGGDRGVCPGVVQSTSAE